MILHQNGLFAEVSGNLQECMDEFGTSGNERLECDSDMNVDEYWPSLTQTSDDKCETCKTL